MIYVKRPSRPAIPIYRSSGTTLSSAELEVKGAIKFFTDRSNYLRNSKLCKVSFGYRIYKDKELAKHLEEMFKGKCAYCESNYKHVTPKEIEHFRPKAEITIDNKNSLLPGYFWLGAEWTNLLISCVDCNRVRNHEVPGQTKRIRLGKGSQFPLDNEDARVRKHGSNLSGEERVRLLINPCKENPEKLLKFDDNGLIHPIYRESTYKGRKAKVSIEVYALQRKPLVEERKRNLNQFIYYVGLMRFLLSNHNRLVSTGTAQAEIDISLNEINALGAQMQEMTAEGAPYLAMLRNYILDGEKKGHFSDLKSFGVNLRDLI